MEARLPAPTEVVSEKRSASSTFLSSSPPTSSPSSAAVAAAVRCLLTAWSRATLNKKFGCHNNVYDADHNSIFPLKCIWMRSSLVGDEI